MPTHNLIIIGGGPAGYTAALYAARANLAPIIFSGPTPGGQLIETTTVENYPGFPEGILGNELMERFRKQAEKYGSTIIDETVKAVDFSKKIFEIQAVGNTYLTKSVIIATGASARWLELESEKKFRGRGVSACATCDGPFFKNKDVLVVGGGDAAMEEALFLTKFARSVKIIHRREEFRASQIMLNRAEKNPKIEFILNSIIVEFTGKILLEGAVIENIKTGQKQKLKVDGAFMAIGHIPNTLIFQNILPIDQQGYIKTKNPPFTNIKGVFVAGDVFDRQYRQAITAAALGCQAAIEAEKYLGVLSTNS